MVVDTSDPSNCEVEASLAYPAKFYQKKEKGRRERERRIDGKAGRK